MGYFFKPVMNETIFSQRNRIFFLIFIHNGSCSQGLLRQVQGKARHQGPGDGGDEEQAQARSWQVRHLWRQNRRLRQRRLQTQQTINPQAGVFKDLKLRILLC
jgi:hypothetical protein